MPIYDQPKEDNPMYHQGRRLLLNALLVSMFGAMAAPPASADPMNGAQVIAQIVGKDLVTRRKGMKVHLRYDIDGTVAVKAPLFEGSGHWTLAGDSLCMTLTDGPRRGETCHMFEDLGGGAYRNSEGQILRQQ